MLEGKLIAAIATTEDEILADMKKELEQPSSRVPDWAKHAAKVNAIEKQEVLKKVAEKMGVEQIFIDLNEAYLTIRKEYDNA